MEPSDNIIGIGATQELALRVSVGVLVRVLFDNPETGHRMLALERTATLLEIEGRYEVIVKAKPFGGGVRITDPQKLKKLIGNFHYDSERSFHEGDFRIMINPASWGKLKEICMEHMRKTEYNIMETGPERELAEEFFDALKIRLTPEDYKLKKSGLIVEDIPGATDNINAKGLPTVRVYYLFEAIIISPEIIFFITPG